MGVNSVSPEFFGVTGVKVEYGNVCGDDPGWTVIVDRTLALEVFGRADVVGRSLTIRPSEVPAEIVGVVAPVRYRPNRLPTLYKPTTRASLAPLLIRAPEQNEADMDETGMSKPLSVNQLVNAESRQMSATMFLLVFIGLAKILLIRVGRGCRVASCHRLPLAHRLVARSAARAPLIAFG